MHVTWQQRLNPYRAQRYRVQWGRWHCDCRLHDGTAAAGYKVVLMMVMTTEEANNDYKLLGDLKP